MTRILGWLDRLPNWLRAGVVTGTFTAVLTSGASVLTWLEEFFAWAAGEPVAFPDLSVLRSAVVGVAAGGVIGGANAAFRWVQERMRRGNPPVYPTRT
jgi:hypothetical protein